MSHAEVNSDQYTSLESTSSIVLLHSQSYLYWRYLWINSNRTASAILILALRFLLQYRKQSYPIWHSQFFNSSTFPLPIIAPGEAVDPVDTFFSHREPSLTNLSIIGTVPLPPITTMTALLEASKGLRDLTFQSVSCSHTGVLLESTLPLLVITFWAEVLSLCETWQPWIWAEDALSKQMKQWGKDSGLVERAYNSLSNPCPGELMAWYHNSLCSV